MDIKISYKKILRLHPSLHRMLATAHKHHSRLSLSTSKDDPLRPSALHVHYHYKSTVSTAIRGQVWAQGREQRKPTGKDNLGIVVPFSTQYLKKHSLFGREQAKWQLFDLFVKSRKVLSIYQIFLLPSYSIIPKRWKCFEWTCLRWGSLGWERVSGWILVTWSQNKRTKQLHPHTAFLSLLRAALSVQWPRCLHEVSKSEMFRGTHGILMPTTTENYGLSGFLSWFLQLTQHNHRDKSLSLQVTKHVLSPENYDK